MRRRWACPPEGGAAATPNSTLLYSETLWPELVSCHFPLLGGGQRLKRTGRRHPLFTLRKPWPQNGISRISRRAKLEVDTQKLVYMDYACSTYLEALRQEFEGNGGSLKFSPPLPFSPPSNGYWRRNRRMMLVAYELDVFGYKLIYFSPVGVEFYAGQGVGLPGKL